jgi:hypothetical protein
MASSKAPDCRKLSQKSKRIETWSGVYIWKARLFTATKRQQMAIQGRQEERD